MARASESEVRGPWAYRRSLSPVRIEVTELVQKLRELGWERAAAKATMNRYLAELGYDS